MLPLVRWEAWSNLNSNWSGCPRNRHQAPCLSNIAPRAPASASRFTTASKAALRCPALSFSLPCPDADACFFLGFLGSKRKKRGVRLSPARVSPPRLHARSQGYAASARDPGPACTATCCAYTALRLHLHLHIQPQYRPFARPPTPRILERPRPPLAARPPLVARPPPATRPKRDPSPAHHGG